MDQGFNVYADDRLGIRITADRGQWFVEVHPGAEKVDVVGSKDWFTLEAWSSCLGTPVLFHDARPTLTGDDWAIVLANSWWLEPQLDYLRDHLARIQQACSPERVEATGVCLSEAKRAPSAFPSRERSFTGSEPGAPN
jgi:hypothetical protein